MKFKIKIGLYASLLTILLVNFVFNETNEIFKYGAEIGNALSNLSLAYVASYIFYRIVVVEREKEIKKTIYISVIKLTNKLLFNGFYILDVLVENEKKDRNKIHKEKNKITEEEYKELCKKINPNSLSRFSEQVNELELKTNTKIESLYIQCVKLVREHIDRIFIFLPYLEDEHIKILNEIRDSKLLSTDRGLYFTKTNKNFSIFENYMYDYFKLILKLENYYNSKMKKLV